MNNDKKKMLSPSTELLKEATMGFARLVICALHKGDIN